VVAFTPNLGAFLNADDTIAPPHLRQPVLWGADIFVQSSTKYLGATVKSSGIRGHRRRAGDADRVHPEHGGGVPGRMDCFLGVRSVKTSAVRLDLSR
jgi:cystathionine beta-lyase/cystathionine gamma-synthase